VDASLPTTIPKSSGPGPQGAPAVFFLAPLGGDTLSEADVPFQIVSHNFDKHGHPERFISVEINGRHVSRCELPVCGGVLKAMPDGDHLIRAALVIGESPGEGGHFRETESKVDADARGWYEVGEPAAVRVSVCATAACVERAAIDEL